MEHVKSRRVRRCVHSFFTHHGTDPLCVRRLREDHEIKFGTAMLLRGTTAKAQPHVGDRFAENAVSGLG